MRKWNMCGFFSFTAAIENLPLPSCKNYFIGRNILFSKETKPYFSWWKVNVWFRQCPLIFHKWCWMCAFLYCSKRNFRLNQDVCCSKKHTYYSSVFINFWSWTIDSKLNPLLKILQHTDHKVILKPDMLIN